MWLRQNTGRTVKIGPFVDEDDGKTAETGLTLTQADIRLSKNGGNMAQKNESSACGHDELGVYDCALSATDTNTAGALDLFVHESGALPVAHSYVVVAEQVYDSLFAGDLLQVHAAEMSAALITATALDATAIASVADAVLDEALAGHTTAGSAGAALQDAADGDYIAGDATAALNARRGYQGLVRGAAVTGTLTASVFSTNLTEATNDHYNDRILTFTSGALAGQSTQILDYNGSTKVLTVAAMTEAPANGNEFIIT